MKKLICLLLALSLLSGACVWASAELTADTDEACAAYEVTPGDNAEARDCPDCVVEAPMTDGASVYEFTDENCDRRFTTLDGQTVSTWADGKPKVILFTKSGCWNCANMVYQVVQGAAGGSIDTDCVDILVADSTGSSPEQVTSDYADYADSPITFCCGADSAAGYYLGKLGIYSYTTPLTVYIDADNTIKRVTTGYDAGICAIIEDLFGDACTAVDPTPTPEDGHTHEIVTDPAVAASCTEDGLTEGAHCSVCGEILTAQQTIPASGHDYIMELTDTAGIARYICSVCGDSYTAEILLPESEHDYANNTDKSYSCRFPGADALLVTFSDDTKVETGWDKIYVTDGSGSEVGTYTGTELAGVTLTVPGDTVVIRLVTDYSNVYYGFRVTDITAQTADPSPAPTDTPAGMTKGDMNDDGMVNIVDALRLFRYVNGQIDTL